MDLNSHEYFEFQKKNSQVILVEGWNPVNISFFVVSSFGKTNYSLLATGEKSPHIWRSCEFIRGTRCCQAWWIPISPPNESTITKLECYLRSVIAPWMQIFRQNYQLGAIDLDQRSIASPDSSLLWLVECRTSDNCTFFSCCGWIIGTCPLSLAITASPHPAISFLAEKVGCEVVSESARTLTGIIFSTKLLISSSYARKKL